MLANYLGQTQRPVFVFTRRSSDYYQQCWTTVITTHVGENRLFIDNTRVKSTAAAWRLCKSGFRAGVLFIILRHFRPVKTFYGIFTPCAGGLVTYERLFPSAKSRNTVLNTWVVTHLRILVTGGMVNRSQETGHRLTKAYRPSASLTVVFPHIRFQLYFVWRMPITRAHSCLGHFRRTQSNKEPPNLPLHSSPVPSYQTKHRLLIIKKKNLIPLRVS